MFKSNTSVSIDDFKVCEVQIQCLKNEGKVNEARVTIYVQLISHMHRKSHMYARRRFVIRFELLFLHFNSALLHTRTSTCTCILYFALNCIAHIKRLWRNFSTINTPAALANLFEKIKCKHGRKANRYSTTAAEIRQHDYIG